MQYECSCHRKMGNDFWFLPTGRCLNSPPVCDTTRRPGPYAAIAAQVFVPDDSLKGPNTPVFRHWLWSNHPKIFDEFFTLNGRYAPIARYSWAGYMKRLAYRKMFADARHARVLEALVWTYMV